MAEHGTLATLSQLHPAVGDLPALLERLHRRDRLTIGTERAQHAAALLDRLARAGIVLDNAKAAADWLAPVLCITARDRAVLSERLAHDALSRVPAAPTPRDLGTLAGEAAEDAARRLAARPWRIGLVVAALLVGGIAAVAAFGPAGGGTGGAVAVAATFDFAWLSQVLPWLAPVLLAMALPLARRLIGAAPKLVLPWRDAPPTGQGLRWFDEGQLHGPLRLLGSHRRALGRQLDLPETIRRTVRRAGWPSLMRGGRPRTPEHLVLVDLAGPDDPLALAAASLLDRLRQADLRVAAFTTGGDFSRATPWGGGGAVSMARVAALYRGGRLLLISDGAALHDLPRNRLTEPATFAAFPVRALVTPTPRAAWGWREAALDRAGWRLAELATNGMAELARWLSGTRETLPPLANVAPQSAGLPARLAEDARLFREDAAPPEALRTRLQDRLAAHLDADPRLPPDGFDLLRVLAIGATLSPGAVERVAAHLATRDGPQPDEATLHRLLALPWLARGKFPTWLREDLLRDLPEALADKARDAWLLHLAGQRVAKGELERHHAQRVAAEAWRVLEASQAGDALMLRMLLLAPPAPGLRERLRDGAIALALVLGGVLAVWAVGQALPLLARLGALVFQPLDQAVLQRALWLPLLACGVVLGVFTPIMRGARAARLVAGTAALYLALGPFLGGQFGVPTRLIQEGNDILYAAAAVLVLALVGLRLAMPARPAPFVLRAAFLPGHPFLNLGACVGMTVLVTQQMANPLGLGTGADDAFTDELVFALVSLGIAGAIAARLALAGFCDREAAWGAGLGFAFGQAVAAGLLGLVFSLGMAFGLADLDRDYGKLAGLLVAARLIGGLSGGAWVFGAAGPARQLNWAMPIVAGLAAVLWRVDDATLTAILSIALQLALLLMVQVVATDGQVRPRWRRVFAIYGMALVLLVGMGLVASMVAGGPAKGIRIPMQATPDPIVGVFRALFMLVAPLLAWPMARAARPDLATRSDGLWWRCLALVPCWLGVHAFGDTFGPLSALAIPIAIWIAHRHGKRAVPAIGVALLPMLLGYGGPGQFGVVLSGNLGQALAALLLARVTAEPAFRAACLGATRVAPWQLAGLAVLPFGYATPVFAGFSMATGAAVLALAIALLIGLSRAPLTLPFAVLAGSSALGFVLQLLLGDTAGAGFGRPFHGLSAWPSAPITVALALFLARRMQREEAWPSLAWVGRLIDQRGFPVALVAVFFAHVASVRLAVPGVPDGHDLTPVVASQLVLLAFYWSYTQPTGKLLLPMGMLLTLPALPVLMLAAALPRIELPLGPLTLVAFAGTLGSGLRALLVLWGFCVLGMMLSPLSRPAAQAAGVTMPVFRTAPVRIGLALGTLALLGMLALAGVLVAERMRPSGSGSTGAGF